MDEPRFRWGLRVSDVPAATAFYSGLGFAEVGSVLGPDGHSALTILQGNGVHLIVDTLQGMPFRDSERERLAQAGTRGLGVAIGLRVDDLEAVFQYCQRAGCTITCEPMDEAWGERVFECLDPFGYQWEFSRPIESMTPGDALGAVQANWFGEPS